MDRYIKDDSKTLEETKVLKEIKNKEMAPNGFPTIGRYSSRMHRELISAYILTGSIEKAAHICGITQRTAWNWKKKPWFEKYLEEAKNEGRLAITVKLAGIVDKAIAVIEDRLANGDIYIDNFGAAHRVPVNARTATEIMNKSMERKETLEKKQAEEPMRNEAVLDRLKSIEARLVQAAAIRPEPKVIDVVPERVDA